MRQEKLGYPFSYGDELTPEMARENRKAAQLFVIKTGKKTSVYLVFTYTVWSTNLGFGKSIQSYSSFSKQPEIVRVVSSRIRGGDLGKSGPGARAKADAARKARKGSIVVDAYSPHNIYCRYHQNCAQKSRLGPLFDRSNTPSTQFSREERRELNRQRTQPKIFDKNITILSQDLQLTTPVDLSQEVSISDAKQTGKSQRTVELLKKTLAKKYSKHRKEFQNPDNSPITSKAEFFDAQVRHFQDSKVVRIPGIYLSKDHDPLNCSFYLNPETNQLISVREHGEYATYVGPRRLDDDEKNRLLKHGVVGQDQARFNDISWIKHGMTAEDVMTNYNFCNNGKLNDQVMDSIEVARQFSEIMKNQSSPNNNL